MAGSVLLIDDDADTLTYMSTILLRGGYRTRTARDGHEGWLMLQEERPDLIILDMMMPRRSGMQLLSEIKAHPVYREIPIFVISGVSQMTGVDMHKYMVDITGREAFKPEAFMEKPIKPDKLLKVVKQILGE